MSRTRLTALTALGLVLLSTAVFFTRRATGGIDAGPPGTSVWEVTITVRGEFPKMKGANKGAKAPQLALYSPPDFRRQHVSDLSWKSDELTRPEGRSGAKGPREKGVWKARPGAAPDKGYRLTYTFHVVMGAHNPAPAMEHRTHQLDAAPRGPTDRTRRPTGRIQSDRREVRELAAGLGGSGEPVEQYRAFYSHVLKLPTRQDASQTALDCLHEGGDDAGKSRLLVALCRSRDIPARVMVGMVLNPNAPPTLHRWVEAWVKTADRPDPHWVPACATYGHFGTRKWPTNYLVVRVGDGPMASGPGTPRVTLFARPLPDPTADGSRVAAFWRAVSLANLPPGEEQLARFLVLLPIAAVVVSVCRVVVGVQTFGVFSPALLGLVFRDLRNLGWGLGIFTATVLVGWMFRKLLDRFHLLLIPRTAVLLTFIIGFLLVVIVVGARTGVAVTGYLALFPLIILTNMVERFWTVEAEDGSWSSFKTLFGTLLVAAAVALALSPDAVGRTVWRFPEALGLVVAVLLLLGRYTGYRLTELYRFRDVIEPPPQPTQPDRVIELYRVPETPEPDAKNETKSESARAEEPKAEPEVHSAVSGSG